MAKPVVDRLEQEWGSQAKVVRLDVYSGLGQAAGNRYGIRAIPTFILFDGRGNVSYREVGRLDTGKVKNLVSSLPKVTERK